jgi:hypothetical protein
VILVLGHVTLKGSRQDNRPTLDVVWILASDVEFSEYGNKAENENALSLAWKIKKEECG